MFSRFVVYMLVYRKLLGCSNILWPNVFLVAQGNLISKRKSDDVLLVDIDKIGCDQNYESADSNPPPASSVENGAPTDGFSRYGSD